jgi:hypothetical protein
MNVSNGRSRSQMSSTMILGAPRRSVPVNLATGAQGSF